MRTLPSLPLSVVLDDCDRPADVLDALALERFVAGEHPHARTTHLNRLDPDADLTPPGAGDIRMAVDTYRTVILAEGDGWLFHADRARDGGATVTVTGLHQKVVDEVIDALIARAVVEAEEGDSELEVGFWSRGSHGARRRTRQIEAPRWADVRANYAGAAAEAVDRLAALDPAHLAGRLLIVHGPPGTGKTSLLRALGQAWRSWCAMDCVLDPECLLSLPEYLNEVILGPDPDDDEVERWRLLVLEDCDEVLHPDARSSAGQGLSRLLNLTDGLLGQGRRVLVCLTTNEDVSTFHPAVVRPGRCLTNLHVPRLSPAEADAWAGAPGRWPGGASLAELFAAREGARADGGPEVRARRAAMGYARP